MISKHQLNTCAINFVKILTSAVVEETKALDTVDRIELLLRLHRSYAQGKSLMSV